jgi:hypothetical protein
VNRLRLRQSGSSVPIIGPLHSRDGLLSEERPTPEI